MVSEQEYVRHEGLEIGFYLLFGVVMAILLPLLIGFGFKGFEESFVAGTPITLNSILGSYIVYYILIVAGLIGGVAILVIKILTIRKGEHPATQSNPTWLRIFSVSMIHDPENGALYTTARKMGLSQKKNWMRWSLSAARMFIIGMLFFGALGILSVNAPKLQIVGIPHKVLQQVTPLTQMFFTAEPPAFAETTTMLLVFMILLGLSAYICSKYNLGIVAWFMIGFIIICPIIGLLWTGFHNIVYGASDQARFVTFIFGWFGSTMTLASGSFILWYCWHFMNNFFAKMAEVAPSKENAIFWALLIWAIVFLLYVSVEFYFWNRKRKQKSLVAEPTF